MSLYPERHGLPKFGLSMKEGKATPFLRELQLLAQTPGIVESFLPTIESFTPNRRDAQEVIKLLDWGRRYHRSDLSSAFHEARSRDSRGKLKEIGVSTPKVKINRDGSKSAIEQENAIEVMAKLLGIVGVRYVGKGLGVVFDGIAVLRGHEATLDNAFVIGINSRTGKMFYHPDFLPNEERTKKVNEVIPPFRSTRTLDSF